MFWLTPLVGMYNRMSKLNPWITMNNRTQGQCQIQKFSTKRNGICNWKIVYVSLCEVRTCFELAKLLKTV